MSEFTTQSFNGFVAQGKLMGTRCKNCEELLIPPRQICSRCGSQQLEWHEFNGEGILDAFTINRTPSSGFKGRCPYAVGIVKLNEGPSISGLLTFDEPEKIKVGVRVSFTVVKDGEKSILAFKKL
ncbi:MAG: Zn-ribbon domain-containing OB-fold protein [Candidatus Bathyarchaeota archaeon]|nr:Zn-ribbon domain-containing OB-fold protein [Candidatus Bathyarchaeota archaeon]